MMVDRDAHLRAIRERSEQEIHDPAMLAALDEQVLHSQLRLFVGWKLVRGIETARRLWRQYFKYRQVPE